MSAFDDVEIVPDRLTVQRKPKTSDQATECVQCGTQRMSEVSFVRLSVSGVSYVKRKHFICVPHIQSGHIGAPLKFADTYPEFELNDFKSRCDTLNFR